MMPSSGKFLVRSEQCAQCLFSPQRIVSAKRMQQILSDCLRKDLHFICHKNQTDGEPETCCRGFYDTQPPGQRQRIAMRLGVVEFYKEKG